MGFREEINSPKARIESIITRYPDIKEVQVHISKDGMRNDEIKNGVYHIKVPSEKFSEAVEASIKVNIELEEKRRKENKVQELPLSTLKALEMFERDMPETKISKDMWELEKYLDELGKSCSRKPKIQQEKKKYTFRKKVIEKIKVVKKETSTLKRNIKNNATTLDGKFKNFGANVKKIAKTTGGKIVAVGLAGLLTAGVIHTAYDAAQQYKEDAAVRIVEVVKEELGAEKIYDNSTQISSGSEKIEYIVERTDGTYVYEAYKGDGIFRERNDGLDEQTREAIAIAAAAQNGNIRDARRANKLADDIENGDVNLVIDKSVKNNDEVER